MRRVCLIVLLLLPLVIRAEAADTPFPEDLSWNTPSEDSRGSMPLGNGDIGLNVWVEKGGDLLFYISKTDAWSDWVESGKGLLKLGRVRVHFDPNPFAAGNPFRQTLKLADGEIAVTAGRDGDAVSIRIWVDANRPVVHIEAIGAKPLAMAVRLESLRPTATDGIRADTILQGQKDRIAWFYRNQNSTPRLTDLTFGGIVQGGGLVVENQTTLKSSRPAKAQAVSIHVLTAQTPTQEQWLAQLEEQLAATDAVDLDAARRQHCQWWRAFWNRSWIVADGTDDARRVTRGYALQRFVSACAGRGAYPIKFNGSIFTMNWIRPEKTVMSADDRDWGGQYWFQNTRAMYWPMPACGDFEMMRPLFRMYQDQLPGNAKAVREYYGHEGAYFAETNPFWGSLPNIKPDAKGNYTLHYYTPILELTAMMLDYFAYTGDRRFAVATLLPIADAGMKFFDQHWTRASGKLLLDPDNAVETYWKARNPMPDVAGLRFDLRGLLALPPELANHERRSRWKRFLGEIPELPVGEANGRKILKPAERHDQTCNSENPELYAIYPFRLFGLGKPGIEIARATFAARRNKGNGCWFPDGIQAALLGDTATARANVVFVLTHKDKQCRFPAFWDHGADMVPDEDNGGNGMQALQKMILQAEGKRIILLPAWPKEWNAHFKLHAPRNTVVEGEVRDGRVHVLMVAPPERLKDVVLVEPDGSLRPYKVEIGDGAEVVNQRDTLGRRRTLPVAMTKARTP